MSAIADRQVPVVHRKRVALTVGAVAAAAAFVLTPVLFAPSAELPAPSGTQLPLFVTLTAVESLVFGAGVVFALFGRGIVAQLFTSPRRATATHLAITWALISWWPHDGLHMVNGANINGLLAIEYGFHVTLIAAAAVIVWALVKEAGPRRA